MARFDTLPPEPLIAESILSAPGWCRVALTMPDARLRERAAGELARSIVASLTPHEVDQDQFTLAL